MAFADTSNKATIRQNWDLPILKHWHEKLQRPLAYFGLPGPQLRDLLDWRHLLGTRTGVESPGHTKKQKALADETIGRLYVNLMVHGLSSGFQLLKGDIEDILLNGTDIYGNSPRLNNGNSPHHMRFKYDVINLDFDGGLGYRKDEGTAKRIQAIKKLFERQEGHSFILFLTINVRDTLGTEIEDYLQGLKAQERTTNTHTIVNWYLNRPNGERQYKLKAAVPSFIRSLAELRLFACIARPPIAYIGHEDARMLHFAFEFQATTSDGRSNNLRSFSLQNEYDLLQLPLLQGVEGQLCFASMQHEQFDFHHSLKYLEFLAPQVYSSIVDSYRGNTVMEIST